MSHTFQQIDRDILYLLHRSLSDWLPQSHLAGFVVKTVEQFDLTSIKAVDTVTEMKHRQKNQVGRTLYSKRESNVEPVFGIIKAVMGFRRFLLRGVESVCGEWDLVCMAWNLKRLHALGE
ncbi:transposase [uncultured Nitrospira sp.]|uniref:transposase n=1 Tax=uncultured Nitrospira sp. TaxID=157176 RepID=UPI0031401718